MAPILRIRNGVGLLALGASLALASPGVNAVRAAPGDTARATTSEQAPAQCAAARAAASPIDPEVNRFLAELQAKHARSFPAAQAPADGEWVVLNNRGYNYGPAKGIELDKVRAEALGR